jgi:hydroxymethylpyrimidine kinase/phosphomethylpyrimidine kinase
MRASTRIPTALTIAGSDSGGGAGIQADLQTFAALGVHGTSAITCITAQNPKQVLGVQACTPAIVRGQLEAVFDQLPPVATKTGMLFSAPIIREVARFLSRHRPRALVVDPVMVSTSGAMLLQPAAIKVLGAELLPLATLLTPNLPEAEILLGRKLTSVEDLRSAARALQSRFGCAVLLKGGHLRGLTEAVDIFREGTEEWLLRAPFVRGVSTHGTGCTYSAAVTGYLARGATLSRAVAQAKEFITQAIARSRTVAAHSVLNWTAGSDGCRRPTPSGRSGPP